MTLPGFESSLVYIGNHFMEAVYYHFWNEYICKRVEFVGDLKNNILNENGKSVVVLRAFEKDLY